MIVQSLWLFWSRRQFLFQRRSGSSWYLNWLWMNRKSDNEHQGTVCWSAEIPFCHGSWCEMSQAQLNPEFWRFWLCLSLFQSIPLLHELPSNRLPTLACNLSQTFAEPLPNPMRCCFFRPEHRQWSPGQEAEASSGMGSLHASFGRYSVVCWRSWGLKLSLSNCELCQCSSWAQIDCCFCSTMNLLPVKTA